MSFLRPRFPGERALAAGIAIDAVGTGMYVPFSLVFFLHVTGLPLTTIGLVLTVTGLIGLGALPVAGIAVDRFGARRVQLFLYVLRGLSFACFPLAHSPTAFAAVALVTSIGTRAFPATLQARLGELVDGENRDRMQALSRSLGNAGLGVGTLVASLLIAGAGDTGYLAAAWLNAASFLVAAVLAARTPVTAPVGAAGAAPGSAPGARARADRSGGYRLFAKDRPFLSLTLANLLVAFGYTTLSVLLPVYAIDWLHVPQGLTGVAFLVNTVLCATIGVPVAAYARRLFTTRTRAAAAGAVLFSGGFVGQIVLGTIRPQNVAVLMVGLVVAVIVLTFGEMVHSTFSGSLSQAAAPAELRGRYLAAYQLSWSVPYALAPTLFTSLLTVDGRLPWLVVATTTLLGGLLLLRVERSLAPAAVAFPPPRPAAKAAATSGG
ncbi:MFS transporter [Streptomyces sp. NPDC048606]|uniref:MFS transporter n=1 Tax=Streptomyces sp. NPDC048606 TaxID=3154726 RepID=UPI00341B5598